ncbi:hypothetical protein C2G38_2183213 [Gigaspora rosea]|uniref:Uncharacterized protein n=1 Tax=Gigaspora rosea TaxID=44941 RepID=A0A397V940_9GLOM|nr:hypothetical protein C2G38_2183213 [Gigaspora rosea]
MMNRVIKIYEIPTQWITIEKDSNNQATMLCLIKIGIKILVELNGHEFFINILEPNIEDFLRPIYQAPCSLAYRFSQSDIVKQLLEDINFNLLSFI